MGFFIVSLFLACWQITEGAVAIFGPFYSNLNEAIGLYCSNLGMGVTHFQASDDHQSYQISSDKSFKMHPSHADLNKIAMQAMKLLSWKKISIIYDGKKATLSKFITSHSNLKKNKLHGTASIFASALHNSL